MKLYYEANPLGEQDESDRPETTAIDATGRSDAERESDLVGLVAACERSAGDWEICEHHCYHDEDPNAPCSRSVLQVIRKNLQHVVLFDML